MIPAELVRAVAAGKFQPAYYFYGSEDYRMVEAQKFLASQFIPDKQLITNYRRLDARTTSCPEVLAELAAYPMLGEKQLVAVAEFQRFKPTEVARILKFLSPPDPHRVVILSSPSARTPKKSSKFFKNVVSLTEPVEFKTLTAGESEAVIERKLSKAGFAIEPQAKELLARLVAGNRGGLETEIDKLISYKAGEDAVSMDDVRSVASGFEAYEIFDLADKIVAGRARESLAHVRQLLAKGQSATGILFFLGQHYLSLYLVKNGKPLEYHRRWLARNFQSQARLYSNEQLQAAITAIAETDSAIRHQRFGPDLAIEQLVVRLLNPRQSISNRGPNRLGRNHA